jgi:formyl-CoA transferase
MRILDLTEAAACSRRLLADTGADVIKIERPGGSDPCISRSGLTTITPEAGRQLFLVHLNANKRGITLDLETRRPGILRNWCTTADIVMESREPGYMKKLGWLRNCQDQAGYHLHRHHALRQAGPKANYDPAPSRPGPRRLLNALATPTAPVWIQQAQTFLFGGAKGLSAP